MAIVRKYIPLAAAHKSRRITLGHYPGCELLPSLKQKRNKKRIEKRGKVRAVYDLYPLTTGEVFRFYRATDIESKCFKLIINKFGNRDIVIGDGHNYVAILIRPYNAIPPNCSINFVAGHLFSVAHPVMEIMSLKKKLKKKAHVLWVSTEIVSNVSRGGPLGYINHYNKFRRNYFFLRFFTKRELSE